MYTTPIVQEHRNLVAVDKLLLLVESYLKPSTRFQHAVHPAMEQLTQHCQLTQESVGVCVRGRGRERVGRLGRGIWGNVAAEAAAGLPAAAAVGGWHEWHRRGFRVSEERRGRETVTGDDSWQLANARKSINLNLKFHMMVPKF